jgi:hypothetical protein
MTAYDPGSGLGLRGAAPPPAEAVRRCSPRGGVRAPGGVSSPDASDRGPPGAAELTLLTVPSRDPAVSGAPPKIPPAPPPEPPARGLPPGLLGGRPPIDAPPPPDSSAWRRRAVWRCTSAGVGASIRDSTVVTPARDASISWVYTGWSGLVESRFSLGPKQTQLPPLLTP